MNPTFSLIALFVLTACADKPTRVWIEAPPGYAPSAAAPTKKIYYQVEDIQSGKKESLAIPVDSLSSNIVVQGPAEKPSPTESAGAAATKADRVVNEGKLPPVAKTDSVSAPKLSYLKGLRELEKMYERREYADALVKLTPLLEEYPRQARLYAMQGTLYRRIGESKLAYESYRRAHELDQANPSYEEAYLKIQSELPSLVKEESL